METKKVSLLDILGCGINFFFRNIGSLFVLVFICLGIPVGLLLFFANYLGRMDLFYNVISGKQVVAVNSLFAENIALGAFSTTFFVLLAIFLFSGFVKSALSLYKNKKFYIADLFSVYKKLPNIIGLVMLKEFLFIIFEMITAPLIYSLGLFIGIPVDLYIIVQYIVVFLIVGLNVVVTNFIGLYFFMVLFPVIDKGKGLFQSSDLSFKLIKGNTIRLIILFVLITFLSNSYKFISIFNQSLDWPVTTKFIFTVLGTILAMCFYTCTYYKLLAIKEEN